MLGLTTLILDTPLFAVTLLLLVVLVIPPIFERLRLPGLVGLLVAGVCLGPNGLQLLNPEDDTIELLSDVGKIYLMFVAGLEIDLADFRKTRNRSLSFGFATFAIPLLTGLAVGRFGGFDWNTSALIGSLLASHTLLAYPIVSRLGVVRNEAITVTIGATIFTDIAALLVLAICIPIHLGDFSPEGLVLQLISLVLYATVVLFGFDWLGREYFRRTGDEQSNQFLFVLGAVFLASLGAQAINVDKIVGAFLAGLAVNDVVGRGPVEEKVVFVGSVLFIPFFFVGMGLLLDVQAFARTLTLDLGLVLGIVGGLILAKLAAAAVIRLVYRYSRNEMLTMWSLSLPQVAATLAAALAGYQAVNAAGDRLLSDSVFNSVIVLMLITSLLGPVLTAHFARRLPRGPQPLSETTLDWDLAATNPGNPVNDTVEPFTIVVSVRNPLTQHYLIGMAALLARHELGRVVPLIVAPAHVHMDEPQLNVAIDHSRKLLQRSETAAKAFGVPVQPLLRIDDDVAQGISRAAREVNAKLVVMGWSDQGLRARLFGSIIDQVFWSSHCPVVVMRLLEEPLKIRRLLVPIKIITPTAIQTVRFAQLFANTNEGGLTLLHVGDRRTTREEVQAFEAQLAAIMSTGGPPIPYQIETVLEDDAARAIVQVSRDFDMVVLRSMRRRTAGGLAVSNVTTQAIQEITCSLVLFGEPHS